MTINAGAVITVADFTTFFDRDFPYGKAAENVRDGDIERAINTSIPLFNPGLFDVPTQKTAALYLAAHLLVLIVKAAGGLKAKGKGINSTGSFPISSKGAGALSVSYSLPQEVVDNPMLFQFTKTEYGLMYLQIIAGNTTGFVFGGAVVLVFLVLAGQYVVDQLNEDMGEDEGAPAGLLN